VAWCKDGGGNTDENNLVRSGMRMLGTSRPWIATLTTVSALPFFVVSLPLCCAPLCPSNLKFSPSHPPTPQKQNASITSEEAFTPCEGDTYAPSDAAGSFVQSSSFVADHHDTTAATTTTTATAGAAAPAAAPVTSPSTSSSNQPLAAAVVHPVTGRRKSSLTHGDPSTNRHLLGLMASAHLPSSRPAGVTSAGSSYTADVTGGPGYTGVDAGGLGSSTVGNGMGGVTSGGDSVCCYGGGSEGAGESLAAGSSGVMGTGGRQQFAAGRRERLTGGEVQTWVGRQSSLFGPLL
jgi:hypothetical protein